MTTPKIQVWCPPDAEEDDEKLKKWVEEKGKQLLKDAFIRRIDVSGLLFGSVPINYEKPRENANQVFNDGRGLTLLHGVVLHITDKSKQNAYITALLEFDADVSSIDYRGRTPLMLAAQTQTVRPEMVKTLALANGAALESQDYQGNTCLIHAVQSGRTNVAKILADIVVKKNQFSVFLLRNESGETAEDVARRLKNKECEKLLSKRRLKLLERVQKQLRASLYENHAKITVTDNQGKKGYVVQQNMVGTAQFHLTFTLFYGEIQ